MVTGVFHTARGGQSLKFNARVRRERDLARFADALAEHDLGTGDRGGDVRKAAEKCGLSPSAGIAMWQRIRRDLGLAQCK